MANMCRDFNSPFYPREPTKANKECNEIRDVVLPASAKQVELLLAINRPLGGDKQTVPRAELQALITCVQTDRFVYSLIDHHSHQTLLL